jgi:hypothetical protein
LHSSQWSLLGANLFKEQHLYLLPRRVQLRTRSLRAQEMPNVPPTSGRNTIRGSRMSSNTKDPPHLRRREDFYKALDQIAADLRASRQQSQACHELEGQFVDHFRNWPCDEEYHSLLADCRQTLLAHRASPSSTHTFLDVLTSTLVRRAKPTRVGESTPEDEHKLNCSPSPLSPRAEAHSSNLT